MSALSIISAFFVMLSSSTLDEPAYPGLGKHSWKVTASSPLAQKYFNEGLAFLYAFNHDEAIRLFTRSTQADPNCAMAWWGIAYANGPNYNNPMVSDAAAKSAWDALSKAKASLPKLTTLEKDMINALTKRYTYPYPEDHSKLDKAYADAMRQVWKKHPKSADIGALFAEALMNLRPWDLWTKNGKPQPGTNELIKALEDAMKVDKYHPLALHLYIHAIEMSPTPEKAKDVADRLRDLQPGLGHMVHMPSHIDVRTGEWHEAIVANEKAIVADNNYRKLSNVEQGFYGLYMTHNHHMLTFAAMMVGESKKAMKYIDEMAESVPPVFLTEFAAFVDGFLAMPMEVRVRFGMWDEVLKYPDFPEKYPIARALRYVARAVAYGAKGMPKDARREQWYFYEWRKKVPKDAFFGQNSADDLLRVAMHLMNGEILVAEGKIDRAIEELKLGVKHEDTLNYNEPLDWIQPVRHTLGAVLLTANRYREAEKVYRDDLKHLPNNGWSLYGLTRALEGQNKTAEAKKTQEHFDRVWASADIKIDSSCLCIPGSK